MIGSLAEMEARLRLGEPLTEHFDGTVWFSEELVGQRVTVGGTQRYVGEGMLSGFRWERSRGVLDSEARLCDAILDWLERRLSIPASAVCT